MIFFTSGLLCVVENGYDMMMIVIILVFWMWNATKGDKKWLGWQDFDSFKIIVVVVVVLIENVRKWESEIVIDINLIGNVVLMSNWWSWIRLKWNYVIELV